MAESNKSRGIQLLRTDDSIPGVVRFYDRREDDVQRAFVAQFSVPAIVGFTDRDEMKELLGDGTEALLRAACHGLTQNILDSSNKLEGDERIAFVRKACATVQAGGWASAPVDEAKARQTAISALVKVGFTPEAAAAIVDKKQA